MKDPADLLKDHQVYGQIISQLGHCVWSNSGSFSELCRTHPFVNKQLPQAIIGDSHNSSSRKNKHRLASSNRIPQERSAFKMLSQFYEISKKRKGLGAVHWRLASSLFFSINIFYENCIAVWCLYLRPKDQDFSSFRRTTQNTLDICAYMFHNVSN